MDNPGWHAQRRAHKEDEAYVREYRRSGVHLPVEDVAPMDEAFIGGFRNLQSSEPRPPPPPPKDYSHFPGRHHVHDHSPSPPQPGLDAQQHTFVGGQHAVTITTSQLAHMNAIERSEALRMARMDPHLQFMCGPLLKYDTIDSTGTWHGAVLIVTADSGSIYDPHPTLIYTWDPAAAVPAHDYTRAESVISSPAASHHSTASKNAHIPSSSPTRPGIAFELGPHPADPHSVVIPGSPVSTALGAGLGVGMMGMGSPGAKGNGGFPVPMDSKGNGYDATPNMPMPIHMSSTNGVGNGAASAQIVRAPGQELWVYAGSGGTFTFWRFKLTIPLAGHEMAVRYSVNGGQQIEFWVPGRGDNMRWAAHSCNGFSSGINPDDFRGPGFSSGYDPLWMDLLAKHQVAPFHVLVGGGDQLYCDALMREPEMQEWGGKMKPEEKKAFPLSEEIELAIDRFFFNHYCQNFRRGAFARANCSIPMLNMCDDHDLIDGFGSYPDDLQRSPVFRQIGARGYFFFLLFQCFIQVEVDGLDDAPGNHIYKSLILGEPGPYVRFPSHSFLTRLGPKVYMLLLDCRAERKKEQVCSPAQYTRVFEQLNALPPGVTHVVVQIGIPIAYPRMVFLEAALESKFNPLVALGRAGTLGLSGFVNKFNAEAELLDDLNDHWTARNHKKERNWFIEQLQNFAKIKRIRVTFLSGDVHCAAVGVLKTLKTKNALEVQPADDYRYMVNVVTSAIVNTPPPNGVIALVSSLATKVHKTLHGIHTDETMLPLFTREPLGQSRKQKFIMGRRNWCQVDYDDTTGGLLFDIRVEREKGYGETVGYLTHVPQPAWQS